MKWQYESVLGGRRFMPRPESGIDATLLFTSKKGTEVLLGSEYGSRF